MPKIALIDDSGWVDGVVFTECSVEPENYPLARQVFFQGDEVPNRASLTTFHDGVRFSQLKNPREIWKRMRASGFTGWHCRGAFDDHIGSVQEGVPESPMGATIGTPSPIDRINSPAHLGEVHSGVAVQISKEGDLDVWERELIASGLYPEEGIWLRAAEWLCDPYTWPIISTWKDEPIQIERYTFSPGKNAVFCGFTTHIDKERPHWFWQQLARPVFKSLRLVGIEQIESHIRSDRGDWAETLRQNYGAERFDGAPGNGIFLRYPIKDSLAFMPDWPYRRTIPGWVWEKDGIIIREGNEKDVRDIKTWSKDAGIWSVKDKLPKMIEKWIEIDNATILLAIKDGGILDAWMVRPRGSALAGVVSLGFSAESKFGLIREGMQKWQRDNGYASSSFFVRTNLKKMPVVAGLRGAGWYEEKEHKHFDQPMTEFRVVL